MVSHTRLLQKSFPIKTIYSFEEDCIRKLQNVCQKYKIFMDKTSSQFPLPFLTHTKSEQNQNPCHTNYASLTRVQS